jgi:hypothetical protein
MDERYVTTARPALRGAATLGPARMCLDCGSWPCRCQRVITESVATLVRECVCGRNVIVASPEPAVVTRDVQRHNLTPQHRAWRDRYEA